MKKSTKTLLCVGAGVAALYLLTRKKKAGVAGMGGIWDWLFPESPSIYPYKEGPMRIESPSWVKLSQPIITNDPGSAPPWYTEAESYSRLVAPPYKNVYVYEPPMKPVDYSPPKSWEF